MLAVGVTALVTAVVLIGVFLGYLYFRDGYGPVPTITSPDTGKGPPGAASKPRPRVSSGPTASEITTIRFLESSMGNTSAINPAGLLGNINVQNFTSSSRTVTFFADGTATREITTESTVNGVKARPKLDKFTATLEPGKFASLAQVIADNDFANEPDSKDITSLPIKKVLTITYSGGEKTIITGHMGRNTLETAAMLSAISELEKQIAWIRSSS